MRRVIALAGVSVAALALMWGLWTRAERVRTSSFQDAPAPATPVAVPTGGPPVQPAARPLPIFVQPAPAAGRKDLQQLRDELKKAQLAESQPVEEWKQRELGREERNRQLHAEAARAVGLGPAETAKVDEAVSRYHKARLEILTRSKGTPDSNAERSLRDLREHLHGELRRALGAQYERFDGALDDL